MAVHKDQSPYPKESRRRLSLGCRTADDSVSRICSSFHGQGAIPAGHYPAWFVEGFAEFNATASFESDGGIGFGLPARNRLLWLYYGWTISLQKMLTRDVDSLKSDEDQESLYARGWLLLHYLNFEPTRHGQLASYLRAVSSGTPSLDAAKSAFGDLDKLKSELVR